MRRQTRARRSGAMVAAVAALAIAAAITAIPAPTTASETLEATDSDTGIGFFTAFSWQAMSVTLNRDERATPVPESFRYDEWGHGFDLVLGYGFSRQFECEFGGAVTVFDAVPASSHVFALDARITGYVPVRPDWRLHPVLLGGVGVTAFGWVSDEFTDRLYLTGRGDLGGGLRYRASPRVTLRAEFVYSMHDVERELLDPENNDGELRHVDGSAFTRTVRVGMIWDF